VRRDWGLLQLEKKQQPLNLLFTFHDEKFLTLMHIWTGRGCWCQNHAYQLKWKDEKNGTRSSQWRTSSDSDTKLCLQASQNQVRSASRLNLTGFDQDRRYHRSVPAATLTRAASFSLSCQGVRTWPKLFKDIAVDAKQNGGLRFHSW
jgi:hypothetical protein